MKVDYFLVNLMEKGNKLHVGLSDIDYGNPMTNGGSQFLDAQFNLVDFHRKMWVWRVASNAKDGTL